MPDDVTKVDVFKSIEKIKHPEIKSTLAELGMIDDIQVVEKKITITIALPLLDIPSVIKNLLAESIRKAVEQLGVKCEIKFTEMSPARRERFIMLARKNWRG